MNSLNFSLKTLLLACSTAFLFSCEKTNKVEELGDAGQTIVKLPSDEGYNLVAMDLVTTPQNINILEVRRDVHNEASLNSTLKVVVTEDPAGITAYNTEHNTDYEELPVTAYTADPSNPKAGSNYTLTFAPGEFVKYLKVSFPNSSTLDPNKQYAVSYKISSIDGNGKASAEAKSVLVEVGLKNRWDGVYKVTGSLVDVVNPALTGTYPLTWELRTSGANTLAVFDKSTGTQTHLISNAGSPSQYGSYGLNITIDPATNKITEVVNSYGQPASNGRSAALDPSGINAYDPGTKTIKIKYFLLQPGTTVRTTFDETWEYTGPR